ERDFDRVIEAYRRVYFEAPNSSKAEPSVFAAAGLLAEQGRRFSDSAALNDAIKEYRFLRKQYPGSRHRIAALYEIGRIYQNDLGDPRQAKGAFQEVLHLHPRSRYADEARQQWVQLTKPST